MNNTDQAVILRFTIRNIYLVLVTVPDTELQKSLGFPKQREQ